MPIGALAMLGAQTGANIGSSFIGNLMNRGNMQAQQRNQMSLMRLSQQQQQDMWNYTNYENQVHHMKKAGINPGLLYGMGGTGGSTTGSGSGGSAAMGQAPGVAAPQIMDIQQQMANVELMKSQANLNNVEAANKGKGGVVWEGINLDNLNKGETFKLIKEQAKSEQGKQAVMAQETRAKELDNLWKTETWETAKQQMWVDLDKSEEELRGMVMRNEITEETMQTEIDTKKLNYIILGVQKRAMEAGISLTQTQTDQVRASIAQRNRELDILAQNANTNEGQLRVAEFINDFSKGQEAALDATKFGVGVVADVVGSFLGISERNMTKIKRMVTRDKAGNVTGSTTTHEGRMKPKEPAVRSPHKK